MPVDEVGGRRLAIFGATSGIAVAVARAAAAEGCRLLLFGRDQNALSALATDLEVRGAAAVAARPLDLGDPAGMAAAAFAGYGGIDEVLLAFGCLPDQARTQDDDTYLSGCLDVNFQAPVLLSEALAARFEVQRHGLLAVITSVAGDRGRRSNYLYGAAKGGLQRYLEGLRHRLWGAGVAVLDIRPGFVRTAMTAHMPSDGLLWSQPVRVGGAIRRAMRDGYNGTLYAPWFWRYIMLLIRIMPAAFLHRTKL